MDSPARKAWNAETHRLRGEILRDAVAYALEHIALQVFAEYEAEIARLKAELDQRLHRNVLHVMERYARQAQESSMTEPEGTIMRATDTGREWVFAGGRWDDHDQEE